MNKNTYKLFKDGAPNVPAIISASFPMEQLVECYDATSSSDPDLVGIYNGIIVANSSKQIKLNYQVMEVS